MELNFSLHDAQLEIFQHTAVYKVVAAGRRFGKSYLAAVTLLVEGMKDINERGFDVSDKEVWYVAPTFQQAKDIMWNLLKTLGRDLIDQTYENTATIKLINGRYIKLKGSDRPDTLRGVGLAYIVLDEFADMKPMVWEEIIYPTLLECYGGAMFIGTPKGKNHFYDIWLDAQAANDDDWEAWHFSTRDNPVIPKELIRKLAGKLSQHAFRQEIEASFESVGSGIFTESMWRFDPNEPKDGYYFVAVDPAGFGDVVAVSKSKLKKLDECAIAVVKVHRGGWWVKEIIHGRWNPRETARKIIMAATTVNAVKVGIEAGALKNAIMPYLEDTMKQMNRFPTIVPVTHGGKSKTDRITWALQGRFEHEQIAFNPGDWNKPLIGQLLDFPNPMSHDDLPDALAYIDQIATVSYADFSDIQDYWEPLDELVGF